MIDTYDFYACENGYCEIHKAADEKVWVRFFYKTRDMGLDGVIVSEDCPELKKLKKNKRYKEAYRENGLIFFERKS